MRLKFWSSKNLCFKIIFKMNFKILVVLEILMSPNNVNLEMKNVLKEFWCFLCIWGRLSSPKLS